MFAYRSSFVAAALYVLIAGSPLHAQQVGTGALVSFADGVLVTSNDVTTCPYTLIGPVSVNMRKTWIGRNELAPERIADKLRDAARDMEADAIVLVTIGQGHMTVFSTRSTPVTGRAIRYVDRSCAPTS